MVALRQPYKATYLPKMKPFHSAGQRHMLVSRGSANYDKALKGSGAKGLSTYLNILPVNFRHKHNDDELTAMAIATACSTTKVSHGRQTVPMRRSCWTAGCGQGLTA